MTSHDRVLYAAVVLALVGFRPVPVVELQSAGARIAFVNDWNGRDAPDEIYSMRADGTDPKRLTITAAGNNLFPKWSPDGRRIAFHNTRDGVSQLYLMNADGTGLTRLTVEGGAWASWSPDGGRIAFTGGSSATAPATREIFLINVDGTGLTRLTDNTTADSHPDWSPNGRSIAFVSNRDGNAEIYAVNVDGTGATRLTSNAAGDNGPDWSPDGRRIAFFSQRDGNAEIYVMNADGTEQVRLTRDDRPDQWPSWSPDGQHIAFQRLVEAVPGLSSPNGSDIFVMRADGSAQTPLTHTAPAHFSAFPSWGPAAAPSDFPTVAVIGNDYAFLQVPDTLAAGKTLLSFENRGQVRHEMSVALLRPGATLAQVLQLGLPAGQRLVERVVGILIARPGDTGGGQLLVDLQPGRRYVVVCNLKDKPDARPHLELGMVTTFEVSSR